MLGLGSGGTIGGHRDDGTRAARRLAAARLTALLVLMSPAPLAAQPQTQSRAPDIAWWGVNVTAATMSALLHALHRREPVSRALLAGVIGGTVMYGGQRIVGADEPGLHLLGMSAVAVGASMPRNVGHEDGLLGEIVVPFYPMYIQLQPRRDPHIRVRASAAAVIGAARLGIRYGTTPDLAASLSSGALVFAVPGKYLECHEGDFFGCRVAASGAHLFGSYAYAVGEPSREDLARTRVHERCHLTQDTRDALLFAMSLSDLVLSDSVAVLRWIKRVVVLDIIQPSRLADRAIGTAGLGGCGRGGFVECEVDALITRRMRAPTPLGSPLRP